MTTLLQELGVGVETIDEQAIADGRLGQCRIVILPDNPTLHNEHAAALARFVRSGGKVLACYLVPPRLAAALGFRDARYVRQQRPGQFAEIRFEAADVAGLPAAVRQDSWNLMASALRAITPASLGRWYDDAGKPTRPGGPAAERSRGVSHPHRLARRSRRQEAALGRGVGRLIAAAVAADGRGANWNGPGGRAIAAASTRRRLRATGRGGESHRPPRADAGRGPPRLRPGPLCRGRRNAPRPPTTARQAYLRAAPSRTARRPGGVEPFGHGGLSGRLGPLGQLLAENGFNMVLPNMLWGGLAHYASDVLPRSDIFRQYGDQIAQCWRRPSGTASRSTSGRSISIWPTAPKDFVEQLRREGRTQVYRQGRAVRLALPFASRKPEAGIGEHVGGRPQVSGRRPALRLHPLSRRRILLLRRLPAAVRGRQRPAGDRLAEGLLHRGPRRTSTTTGAAGRSRSLVAAVSREAKQDSAGAEALGGRVRRLSRLPRSRWPRTGRRGSRRAISISSARWTYTATIRSLPPGARPDEAPSRAECRSIRASGPRPATAALADRVVGQIAGPRPGGGGFSIFNFDADTAASIVPAVGLGAGAPSTLSQHTNLRSPAMPLLGVPLALPVLGYASA